MCSILYGLVVAVHFVVRAYHVRTILVVESQHKGLQRVADCRQEHGQLHRSRDLIVECQKAAEGHLECAQQSTDECSILHR